MNISSKYLAELYANECELETVTETRLLLWQLLVRSLSNDEHMVYQYIDLEEIKRASSTDIATQFDMSIKWASMILNKLWQYNLLERKEIIDARGKHYVYRRHRPPVKIQDAATSNQAPARERVG